VKRVQPSFLFFIFLTVLVGTLLIANFRKVSNIPNSGDDGISRLQVSLNKTFELRQNFSVQFMKTSSKSLRPVYEEYLSLIGANGLIYEIHGVKPGCHDEGHDLGKVFYANLKSIGPSLRLCQDACNSGCMHGVLMEAFSEDEPHEHLTGLSNNHGHVELSTLKSSVSRICDEESLSELYLPGDCAHGVGHASMYLSNYNISKALDNCRLFDNYPFTYYCATGAFMEYNTNRHRIDSRTRKLFYPCDESNFPAACFRYKLVKVSRQHTGSNGVAYLASQCLALDGKYRLGCSMAWAMRIPTESQRDISPMKRCVALELRRTNTFALKELLSAWPSFDQSQPKRAAISWRGGKKTSA